MNGTFVSRRRVAELADKIRESLDLAFPVDVELAVERLGGRIDHFDAKGFDACIHKAAPGDRSQFRIVVQPKERHPQRYRFSVAHELAHLFLHMGYLIEPAKWNSVGDYRDTVRFRNGYTQEELEANEFAAAFLMPDAEYRRVVEQHTARGIVDVGSVAKVFNVSISAASLRGRRLGLF